MTTRDERLAAERVWDWQADERQRAARGDERRALAGRIAARDAEAARAAAVVPAVVDAIRATELSFARDAHAAARRARGESVTAADGVAAAAARRARRGRR